MFKKTKSGDLDLFKSIFSQVGTRKGHDLSSKSSWYNLFEKEVYSKIDEDSFKVLYKGKTGRPNQSVRLIVSMLILKEGMNLTDEQLFESGRFDMRFMLALGQYNIDSELPAPSTYYAFKKAVLEYNEKNNADLLGDTFNKLATDIVKCFNIQGQHIRMDSKLFSSNIARSTRLDLVLKCIQEWHKQNMDKVKLLNIKHQQLVERVTKDPSEKITYRMPKDEQNQLLQDLIELIDQIKSRELENDLIGRLHQEQVTKDDQGGVRPKDRSEISANTLQSAYDTEAAYRQKASGARKQEVQGYVSNITETCDSNNFLNIITNIQTKKASSNDESFFIEAIKQSTKILGSISEVTTDGVYNSQLNKNFIDSQSGMKWNLQNMQGEQGEYIFEWVDNLLNVIDTRSGEKLIAKKTPAGKYRILLDRQSSCSKARYFEKHTIDNYFRRQLIKQDIKYTSQMRANVESTIHHSFYTLKGNKTKYRGLLKNHQFVTLRCIWVNFKRVFKKLQNDLTFGILSIWLTIKDQLLLNKFIRAKFLTNTVYFN